MINFNEFDCTTNFNELDWDGGRAISPLPDLGKRRETPRKPNSWAAPQTNVC